MRALCWLTFVTLLAVAGPSPGQDGAPDGDLHKVFLVVDQPGVVKGKATFAPWAKEMMETLTKERPLLQRPVFGGFTPVRGDGPKTMFADAVKAKAGAILHVHMLESVKDRATKKTTLSAQYTLYEPKKDADPAKPDQFWLKGATEKIKAIAPEIDPDALGAKVGAGQLPHNEYQFLAVDLQAALVKREVVAKGIDGKVDKSTLTVTVMVFNAGRRPIRGLVLALPQDGYVKYCPGKADVGPGETKKVTFEFKDSAANKLVWKTGKLAEVYVDRAGGKNEPKKK